MVEPPPPMATCKTPRHGATCTAPYTVLLLLTTVPTISHELSTRLEAQDAHVLFFCDKGRRVPHTIPKRVAHLPIASSFPGHTFSLPASGHPPLMYITPPPRIPCPAAPRVSTTGIHTWRPPLPGAAIYLPLHLFCPCQCQCQQKRGREIGAIISSVLAAWNYPGKYSNIPVADRLHHCQKHASLRPETLEEI